MEPYELIADPYTLYVGPVGTAFPAIDAEIEEDPEGWFKLGTSGAESYGEDGVTVTPEQSVNEWKGAGSTATIKPFRTSEAVAIGASLADLSTDQHAKVLDDATVETVAKAAETAGEKSFDGYRGPSVATFALLARGMSAEDNALNRQLEVPACFQNGSTEHGNKLGEPAMLVVEFRAIRPDSSKPLWTVRNQTDAAE